MLGEYLRPSRKAWSEAFVQRQAAAVSQRGLVEA